MSSQINSLSNQGFTWSGFATKAVAPLLIGGAAVYLIKKVGEEMENIDHFGSDRFEYQVIMSRPLYPLNSKEIVIKALDRIKTDDPEEYEALLQNNALQSSSSEDIAAHFSKKLTEGCCYGIVNALFDKITRGTSNSLKESVLFIQDVDIFYYQLLQNCLILAKKDSPFVEITARQLISNKKIEDLKKALEERTIIKYDKTDYENDVKSMITLLNERVKKICHEDHARNFLDSEKFSINATTDIYRQVLEKTMLSFPKEEDIVGTVDLPKHTIGFQYGPRGYFLYDSFDMNKGLFEYYDPKTFFFQLKEHVLYDVPLIKQSLLEKENQDV